MAFQSTSPAGDDSASQRPTSSFHCISIHISRRRWLKKIKLLGKTEIYFNPHLPQEMTHLGNLIYMTLKYFNPHLPQEMTLLIFLQAHLHYLFQSTSPAGDDSNARIQEIDKQIISIHISRRRWLDLERTSMESILLFQSTSPAGDDSIYNVNISTAMLFQSTSPAGDDSIIARYHDIRNSYFNPHLPQEMTPYCIFVLFIQIKFQSTSPAGDDSFLSRCWCMAFSISIHISRRRWLLFAVYRWYLKQDFNPHLPQEMTLLRYLAAYSDSVFQSTSPAGDDSIFLNAVLTSNVISIHISRRRWLKPQTQAFSAHMISIHISRRRWLFLAHTLKYGLYISIHISRRRWLCSITYFALHFSISIHISRRRWLLRWLDFSAMHLEFQSTSPAGDDSGIYLQLFDLNFISIHISRRRWLSSPPICLFWV